MERNFALIVLFAALICALGFVPPISLASGVPISAQSLGVMLAGAVLGSWRGALAVLVVLGLVALGLPVLAGWSRKSSLGAVTGGRPVGERLAASVAAALAAAHCGARIVRVHDVAETADALKVWQAADLLPRAET